MEENDKKAKALLALAQVALQGSPVGRAQLASVLGKSYGSDRDLYAALGYPAELHFDDYYARYKRQDIAKALISRPVSTTWRGDIVLAESRDERKVGDEDKTEFEKAWITLDKQLGLKSRLIRVDKLAALGSYGVLLLGFSDVTTREDFSQPVHGQVELLYCKPLSEASAEIVVFEEDPSSPRYGLPEIYSVRLSESESIRVHYSRIIHVVGELLESEFIGLPVLEDVWNRLQDLEKIVGGSAEMYWRGARPGYQGKVDSEYQLSEADIEAVQTQLTEFEHNLRRFFVNEGLSLEALQQQVADPSSHVDVQIQMISASKGIPKRVLTGSERGEQASTMDREHWYEFISDRRQEYAEPNVLRPFVDRLIGYGVLPPPSLSDDYIVQWEDLWSMSDREKAEVGKIRAEAIHTYAGTPGSMDIVPPTAFQRLCLGLDDAEIEYIQQFFADLEREEDASFEGAEEELDPENDV